MNGGIPCCSAYIFWLGFQGIHRLFKDSSVFCVIISAVWWEKPSLWWEDQDRFRSQEPGSHLCGEDDVGRDRSQTELDNDSIGRKVIGRARYDFWTISKPSGESHAKIKNTLHHTVADNFSRQCSELDYLLWNRVPEAWSNGEAF